MTLLGTSTSTVGFKMGVAGTAGTETTANMDMSLDELIKSRRNIHPKSIKKSVSNTDKSIATMRARRNANMDARRGLQTNNRPTSTQVEHEIKKQAGKTAIANAKAASQVKPTPNNKTGKEKAAMHRQKRDTMKQGKAAVAIVKPPSKKAVTAAVNAMQSAGFTIPPGQQMVISFAPIPGAAATTVKGPLTAPPKQNNNPRNNQNTNPSNNQNTNPSNNQNKAPNNSGRNNNSNNNRRRPPPKSN